MKIKLNKYIVLILIILVTSVALISVYLKVYLLLKDKNNDLNKQIQNSTAYLAQLRTIEGSKNQFEAELHEYKKLMERYHLYYEEYGTYTKLIELFTDIERRLSSEILSISKGENDIKLIMNIKYSSLKDLLTELESIEFFYKCNNLKMSKTDTTEFSLSEINNIQENNSINDLTVEISAVFSKDLNYSIVSIDSEIEQLLLDLGFKDAVVSP
ncbi:hypothetical protein IMX26_03570 [Clostridium sp. 'deep sea']|uniref:hypothetical protein n=1 Tax=Clostridium sp. 'deep sea' TaxID=2779445 RepID=UPI0018967FEE|nr:hypothetical protein [Clostridium sp. 'deep sea']QOR35909.1 hypothetical protein IMX26_03570 [Clostridium sp. 'deep sea']